MQPPSTLPLLRRQLGLLRRCLSERNRRSNTNGATAAADATRAFASSSPSTTSTNDPLGAPPKLPQRRVVVTGIGIVSPLAVGASATWSRLLNGDTAVRALVAEDFAPFGGSSGNVVAAPSQAVFESLPSRVGACVPHDQLTRRLKEAADKAADKARERALAVGGGACAIGGKGGGASSSSSLPDATTKAAALAAERVRSSFDPRRSAPFMLYALVAAQEAMDDASWHPASASQRAATAVFCGAGMPAAAEIAAAGAAIAAGRVRRVSPFFVPRILPNLAGGAIAIAHGLRGPNHAASTACATGLHAVGDAFRALQRGEAAVALAGATEAAIDAIALGGFARLKGLSTAYTSYLDAAAAAEGASPPDDHHHHHPASRDAARSSRPFDRRRDGFVLGEGAAILILEDLEHARARGATAYAEVRGYGLSGDACHVTQPHVRGLGAALAMRRALGGETEAGRRCLRHINAHATSTPMGDDVEALAIARVLGQSGVGEDGTGPCALEADEDGREYLRRMLLRAGEGDGEEEAAAAAGGGGAAAGPPLSLLSGLPPLERVAVSSTKGATGHLLGAAGAVEAAFTALAVAERVAPPTANLDEPDPAIAALLPVLVGGGCGGSGGGGGVVVPGPYALGEDGDDGPVAALCNSFGFGGTNASVLFATPPEDVRRRSRMYRRGVF
jgi:3-oxoacyl-[acyl-carrier-protein] synthase II